MTNIKEIIVEQLKKLSLAAESSDLGRPKNISHGDFSFFIKDKNINPADLDLTNISHKYIEKVSLVGKFINFHLSQTYFSDFFDNALIRQGIVGMNNNLHKKRIIVEYTDPNPFKEFHIGHLMSNSIGESISRILQWSGAEITRANYQGDVGLHVAKAIWGILKLEKEKPDQSESEKKQVAFLGKAYVYGSNAYEENPESKKEINELNKTIYEKSDSKVNELYSWGREVSLKYFETIYKKLGTKFDLYFFESEIAPIGMFVVEELLAKGILENSDGAVVFKGEQYGLHTRVFLTSKGLPTYETKELGLTKAKFDRRDFNQSIVITASEQKDYFSVVLKVLEFVDHRAAHRTRHITHGMMRFAEGKMSSRKGNVITGESLIADVEKLVQEKVKDRDIPQEEKDTIAEQVAVGAIKYSILKQSPGKDIIFDFNKSLSFEGDSGPYLQYTHARISSVLRKAVEAGISQDDFEPEAPTELEHILAAFPDVVERAQKELAPQLIVTYLTNLASAFNHYYAENVIVDANKPESAYRVRLTSVLKGVFQEGLFLLGIKAPEKM